jgi:hypothetical protein
MNRHALWIPAFLAAAACVVAFIGAVPVHAQDQGKKPNILVIFGDDIGLAPIRSVSWASGRLISVVSPRKG